MENAAPKRSLRSSSKKSTQPQLPHPSSFEIEEKDAVTTTLPSQDETLTTNHTNLPDPSYFEAGSSKKSVRSDLPVPYFDIEEEVDFTTTLPSQDEPLTTIHTDLPDSSSFDAASSKPSSSKPNSRKQSSKKASSSKSTTNNRVLTDEEEHVMSSVLPAQDEDEGGFIIPSQAKGKGKEIPGILKSSTAADVTSTRVQKSVSFAADVNEDTSHLPSTLPRYSKRSSSRLRNQASVPDKNVTSHLVDVPIAAVTKKPTRKAVVKTPAKAKAGAVKPRLSSAVCEPVAAGPINSPGISKVRGKPKPVGPPGMPRRKAWALDNLGKLFKAQAEPIRDGVWFRSTRWSTTFAEDAKKVAEARANVAEAEYERKWLAATSAATKKVSEPTEALSVSSGSSLSDLGTPPPEWAPEAEGSLAVAAAGGQGKRKREEGEEVEGEGEGKKRKLAPLPSGRGKKIL